jgi:hypothetical protein
VTEEPAEPDLVERSVVYADLGGPWEISIMLGVQVSLVNRWIERRQSTGCPMPVRVLKTAHIYSMAEWRGWYAFWKATRSADNWRINKIKRRIW